MGFLSRKPKPESSTSTPGIADRILPFVAAPESLPPGAVEHAPEVLPGLVAAVAALEGDQLDFMAEADMENFGGAAAVREVARANMRRLPQPRSEALRATAEDPSSTYFALFFEDVFGASRVAILPELISLIAGPQLPPHGVLVAVPRWHLVLLHIVRGAGTLTAMKAMAQAARGEAESVPERGRVSEDVFFVAPDWRAQRVTYRVGERIAADTRGLLGEHLAALLTAPG